MDHKMKTSLEKKFYQERKSLEKKQLLLANNTHNNLNSNINSIVNYNIHMNTHSYNK